MRTLLLTLCGLGIGAGFALAIAALNPPPPTTTDDTPGGHEAASVLSMRRVLPAVACAGIVYAATGWIASIPIALAGVWFLPGMLGPDKRHEHTLAVIDAIAAFTEMLRDTLGAAAGLNQALTVACRHAPPALQPAAVQLAEHLESREGTTREALHAFADTVDDPTCDLVALALAAASEHPTRDLASLLTSLATTAREQAAMRTRTAVAQARTRTAIRMITAITVGLAVLLLIIDRGYLANYDSATGQIILLWVAGIFALALRWLHSLSVVETAARLWTEKSEAASWRP